MSKKKIEYQDLSCIMEAAERAHDQGQDFSAESVFIDEGVAYFMDRGTVVAMMSEENFYKLQLALAEADDDDKDKGPPN